MAGNNGVLPEFTQIANYLNSIKVLPTKELNKMLKTMKIYLGKKKNICSALIKMDIDQVKKLSRDKIEADFLTKIVRCN